MVFDPARVGQNCEFCGSPALVDYQEIRSPIRPQGVLPFRIDASRVRDDIRRWWKSRWFAPGPLARAALVDTIKSLYIPYWTFDAQRALSVDGRGRLLLLRQCRRVATAKAGRSCGRNAASRWEPAAGVVDTFFDDEAVPGTQGLPLDLLERVEPFPTKEVMRYDTAFLSGHVVEHYQVVLLDAAQRSLEQMHAKLETLCAQQVPGDTYRNLQIDLSSPARTFKHVLVPVWLLTVRLRGEALPGDRQWLHRHDRRPASVQRLEDRAAACCWRCSATLALHLARFESRQEANSGLQFSELQGRDWALVVWGLGVDSALSECAE